MACSWAGVKVLSSLVYSEVEYGWHHAEHTKACSGAGGLGPVVQVTLSKGCGLGQLQSKRCSRTGQRGVSIVCRARDCSRAEQEMFCERSVWGQHQNQVQSRSSLHAEQEIALKRSARVVSFSKMSVSESGVRCRAEFARTQSKKLLVRGRRQSVSGAEQDLLAHAEQEIAHKKLAGEVSES